MAKTGSTSMTGSLLMNLIFKKNLFQDQTLSVAVPGFMIHGWSSPTLSPQNLYPVQWVSLGLRRVKLGFGSTCIMFIPGSAQLSESCLDLRAPQQCPGFPHPDQSCPVWPSSWWDGDRSYNPTLCSGTLMLPTHEHTWVSHCSLCKVTPLVKPLGISILLKKRGTKVQDNKAKSVLTNENHIVFGRQIGVPRVYMPTTSSANWGIGKSEKYLYNTHSMAPSKIVGALFIERGNATGSLVGAGWEIRLCLIREIRSGSSKHEREN